MGVFSENAIIGASAAGGYDIEKSVVLDTNSYFTRTPSSSSNRRTWTWSGWVKRGVLTDRVDMFGTASTGAAGGAGEEELRICFTDADIIQLGSDTGGALRMDTTPVYRDPSDWYHIVFAMDTTQATDTNRMKLYVNGEQVTALGTTNYPTQNLDTAVNYTHAHYIGGSGTLSDTFGGYLAEVNFIDGQALTPASFGETNSDTNQWQAVKYAGSYGTNGFYLDFATRATDPIDASGNGNNWGSVNVIAGDWKIDSPTNNFATLSPLWMSQSNDSSRTFAEGNLKAATGVTNWKNLVTTQNISSGKWYWECVPFGDNFNWQVGVCRTDWKASTSNIGPESAGSYCIYCSGASSGGTWDNGSYSALNRDVWAANDILMVAYDDDTGKFWLGKNGTWFNSGNPSSGSTPLFTVVAADRGDIYPIFAYHTDTAGYYINTGADSSFSGQKTAQGNTDGNDKGDFYYTPPSGYLALCEDNLPDPSIADPTAHFNTVLYTGDNTDGRSITGVGFEPNLVWQKNRSSSLDHILYDNVRTVGKELRTNTSGAETFSGYISSFNSDGFTVNTGGSGIANSSGGSHVAWNWKAGGTASSNSDGTITSSVSANPTAGFSIASYTGNATTGATVGHGLSQAPEMLIVKQRDATKNWSVLANSDPTDYLMLNSDNATADDSGFWNDTNPSSSVFTLGSLDWVNANTNTYIAYCFHSVDGYSKVGSYVGNDSPNGPFIATGFRPAFLMLKAKDRGDDWIIVDNKRDSYNILTRKLNPNTTGAEITNHAIVDFVSNGFKIRDNSDKVNLLNSNYFYLAFAESPFKYSNAR